MQLVVETKKKCDRLKENDALKKQNQRGERLKD